MQLLKIFKGLNYDMAFLGFPNSILNDILGIAEAKGYTVNKQEKLVTIGGIEIMEGFEGWKNEIPCQTHGKPDPLLAGEPTGTYEPKQGLAAPRHEGIATLVLARIKSFPVAERTPIECQQFIVELQNTINGKL